MSKILGLDLGTNSIGWAIVKKQEEFQLLNQGVHVFSEGVKIEKGVESSKAAERTRYRSARKLKSRRRKRKQETLKTLIKYGMCPLSGGSLSKWVQDKSAYPKEPEFLKWLRTDEGLGVNPYYYRDRASRVKVGKMELGRALFHISQRRGFKSNRLDQSDEATEGKVKEGISELSKSMKQHDCETLGQYFNLLYGKNSKDQGNSSFKIRGRYTGREEHYLHEYLVICETQDLDPEVVEEIKNAIFYQRPLKSQRGQVGKCTFEKNKPRCSRSHPLFEKYRALQVINNIKIFENGESRSLTREERDLIWPKFVRKSKPTFKFEELAKALSPRGRIVKFNYKDYTSIEGCPTIAHLISVFGPDWEQAIFDSYTRKETKNGEKSLGQVLNDVWHALVDFSDQQALASFAQSSLGLNEELSAKFADFKPKRDYAQISLKAIRKTLPYLESGYLYSHSVFLANVDQVVGDEMWASRADEINADLNELVNTHLMRTKIELAVNELIQNFRKEGLTAHKDYQLEGWELVSIDEKARRIMEESPGNQVFDDLRAEISELYIGQLRKSPLGEFLKRKRLDERVEELLIKKYAAQHIEKLYHPSDIKLFADAQPHEDGNLYLGSPIVPSVRNPMAMRTLHQLRKLINELIKQGQIDEETVIHIELSRELNDSNKRQAIQRYQRERNTKRESYKEVIAKHFKEELGKTYVPTETDVLKYQLWEEQGHKCLYTGKSICISDFIGDAVVYQIEHTLPRSVSQDDSQANKTLAHWYYNTKVKGNKLPSALPNFEGEKVLNIDGEEVHCPAITAVISEWEKKFQDYSKRYQSKRIPRGIETKEQKDNRIQEKHYLKLHVDYWKAKHERFSFTELPRGFKNSQLIDTGIITKFSRQYLQSVFSKVYTVKGEAVAKFREVWGLQEAYIKKERGNHIHHCIDAITIACLTRDKYDELAYYYRLDEENRTKELKNLNLAIKPWPTFVEDLKKLEHSVFVSSKKGSIDQRQPKKKLRKRGKIQKTPSGDPIYRAGDGARGSLHQETFYGAIQSPEHQEVRYVVRKPVNSLGKGDIKNIVDPSIRDIILKAVDEKGLKEAVESGFQMPSGVPIRKVRCFAKVTDPIHLKKHRDVSKQDHKIHYHVANEGNALMAVYEGINGNGKKERAYEIVNMLDLGSYEKLSNRASKKQYPLIPEKVVNKKGQDLYRIYELKKGVGVLFFEGEDYELKAMDAQELNKRLFNVAWFDKSGRVFFRKHNEAKQDKELTEIYKLDFERQGVRVRIPVNKLQILVQDIHFKLSITGEIEFLD